MGRLARVGDLRGAVRSLAPGDGGGGREPVRRPASPTGVARGAGLAAPVGGPGCRGLLPALRQALPGRRVRVHQHFAYAGLRGRHPGVRDGGHRHRAVRSARAPRGGPVHARRRGGPPLRGGRHVEPPAALVGQGDALQVPGRGGGGLPPASAHHPFPACPPGRLPCPRVQDRRAPQVLRPLPAASRLRIDLGGGMKSPQVRDPAPIASRVEMRIFATRRERGATDSIKRCH